MSVFPWKRKKKRVCVIGLDGTPHSLLEKMIGNGVMPEFAKIVEDGHLTRMTVSLPEISSVSWTTFMTGQNPGVHGIYGFTDFADRSYNLRYPNFLDVKVPTFWDVLGRKKIKSIVINQPSTYPARKIPGVLISGFVALDLNKSVTPPTHLEALENMGYLIDIDTMKCREDPDLLRKDLLRTFGSRERAVDHFWKKEEWDYFQVVITGTDRLQHFLWDAYEDFRHPHHETFIGYYQRIDRFIGKMFDKFLQVSEWSNPSEGFFMLSDHGFTGIKQEVYLNTWLQQEGYQIFEGDDSSDFNRLSSETRVLALDPGRFYFHTKHKFPKGTMEEPATLALTAELKEKLLRLEYNGEPVIRKVFSKDEIYQGPATRFAPDLLLLSNHGYDLKGSLKQKSVFGRTVLQGMHTWDDAFLWSLRPQKPDLNIQDISSRILEMMGK